MFENDRNRTEPDVVRLVCLIFVEDEQQQFDSGKRSGGRSETVIFAQKILTYLSHLGSLRDDDDD